MLAICFCQAIFSQIEVNFAQESPLKLEKSNMVMPDGKLLQQGMLKMRLDVSQKGQGQIRFAAIRFRDLQNREIPWMQAQVIPLSQREFQFLVKLTPEQCIYCETLLKSKQWPLGFMVRFVYTESRALDTGMGKVTIDHKAFFSSFTKDKAISRHELEEIVKTALRKGILSCQKAPKEMARPIADHLAQKYFAYTIDQEEIFLSYQGQGLSEKGYFYLSNPLECVEEASHILLCPKNFEWEHSVQETTCNMGKTSAVCKIWFYLREDDFAPYKIRGIHIFLKKLEKGKSLPGKPLWLDAKKPMAAYDLEFFDIQDTRVEYALKFYLLQGKPIEIPWQKLDRDGRFSLPSHYESLAPLVWKTLLKEEKEEEEDLENE